MLVEYIVAFLILAVYIWLIFFAVKGGNMTFGFFFTAILWTVISLVAWHSGILSSEFLAANASYVQTPVMDQLNTVFQTAIRNQGLQTVDIITGAWFGAVLMETGISQALIRKAVEFGGDRPMLVLILLDIVVAALFTSVFGIGAVIALGIIVLPILFSLGVPKIVATLSYLFSVAAGTFMNPVMYAGHFSTYSTDAEGVQHYNYQIWASEFGYIATIVAVIFVVVMSTILMKSGGKKTAKAWAAPTDSSFEEESKNPPNIALVFPFLPTIIILLFKTQNLPTFLFCGWLTLIVCGYCKTLSKAATSYSKTLVKGVVDSAGLIVFLIMLGALVKSIGLAQPFLSLVLEPIIPKNAPVVLCIAVMVLAPLALFRGPLTIHGTAGPIIVILTALGYPLEFLFPLIIVPSICMNIAACPTQSYVAWGISYAKLETKEYIKKSIPWGWIFCILMEILVILMVTNY